MQKPIVPTSERARQKSLYSINILDTLPEKDYDQITQLASYICGTEISVISFIDNDRQWFKSQIGLGTSETSRDVSFCGHAINRPHEIFEIENAVEDTRFHDNPLVTGDPNIRFYAGVPLVKDGNALGTLCVIDSKPKKLNKQQKEALTGLANQVMKLLELRSKKFELEAKIDQLNAAYHELHTFSYSISHNLKAPLGNISAFTSLIIKEDHDLEELSLNRLKSIVKNVRNIDDQLRDTLEYFRLSTSEIIYEPVDIESIIRSVLMEKSKENNIKWKVGTIPVIKGNKMELTTLWQSLISNAIKYTASDKVITIDIEGKANGASMEYSIRDNGIGFEKKYAKKIFLPFQRLHHRDEYGGGTGMGLALVDKIVKKHNGKITVETEIGKGTTFTIKIPIIE